MVYLGLFIKVSTEGFHMLDIQAVLLFLFEELKTIVLRSKNLFLISLKVIWILIFQTKKHILDT